METVSDVAAKLPPWADVETISGLMKLAWERGGADVAIAIGHQDGAIVLTASMALDGNNFAMTIPVSDRVSFLRAASLLDRNIRRFLGAPPPIAQA